MPAPAMTAKQAGNDVGDALALAFGLHNPSLHPQAFHHIGL